MKRIGPTTKKIMILLNSGISLITTSKPKRYFSVLKSASKEWSKINQKSLREAIRNLYTSKLIDCKENKDGTVSMTLNRKGKILTLKYNLENLKIKKPIRWDNLWRIVIFDIPEYQKAARMALSSKLKKLGFYPMQKSVFIYPYDCKKEIDFIVEIFDVRPFVRFIIAKETDIDLDLKRKFKIR